ncbi:hypothetical protein [Streptomyces sp. NPDC026673]|uniref:hypothetical protein n=1 Tax=Streptomyces sp. NPDC026673 TaxID=3155724 RepID=UPI003401225E
MTGPPEAGAPLARLMRHHGLDPGGVEGGSAAPEPAALRRLAPALGLHPGDVFVIAGVPLPEDLAPLDDRAGRRFPRIVGCALVLPAQRRSGLGDLVRSLPRQERTRPVPAPRPYERYPPGAPGGLILRLLGRRNLSWVGAAQTLYRLSDLCLAASTIGAVGRGRKELTPELVRGFAAVLGIPVVDLAVLTGVGPPSGVTPPDGAVADAAALLAELYRLTDDQARQVEETAESLSRG